MYAIIRRYTPDVIESGKNECYADITGLRTFFKMTYAEIASEIKNTLAKEIGIRFVLSVGTADAFKRAKNISKTTPSISTYKEINTLLSRSISESCNVKAFSLKKDRPRLTVPFIGRVS